MRVASSTLVVLLLAVALAVVTGCGGAPPVEAAPADGAAETTPAAVRTSPPPQGASVPVVSAPSWYCTTSHDDITNKSMKICDRTRGRCSAREAFVRKNEHLKIDAACSPTPEAYCVGTLKKNVPDAELDPGEWCMGDMIQCEDMREATKVATPCERR